MSIKTVEVTNNNVIINGVKIIYNKNTMTQSKADDLASDFQLALDGRQLISGLPSDDPDKTTDPNRENIIWDGSDLVSRTIIIVRLEWDGSNLIPHLKNTRPIPRK